MCIRDRKKDDPARPIAGRLGPPPQTILRGGVHADKRSKPRIEEKRLAMSEALSAFCRSFSPLAHLCAKSGGESLERSRRTAAR